jgi:hypothetical protein
MSLHWLWDIAALVVSVVQHHGAALKCNEVLTKGHGQFNSKLTGLSWERRLAAI